MEIFPYSAGLRHRWVDMDRNERIFKSCIFILIAHYFISRTACPGIDLSGILTSMVSDKSFHRLEAISR